MLLDALVQDCKSVLLLMVLCWFCRAIQYSNRAMQSSRGLSLRLVLVFQTLVLVLQALVLLDRCCFFKPCCAAEPVLQSLVNMRNISILQKHTITRFLVVLISLYGLLDAR